MGRARAHTGKQALPSSSWQTSVEDRYANRPSQYSLKTCIQSAKAAQKMEQPIAQNSQKGFSEDGIFACLQMLMSPWMRKERDFDYIKLSAKETC